MSTSIYYTYDCSMIGMVDVSVACSLTNDQKAPRNGSKQDVHVTQSSVFCNQRTLFQGLYLGRKPKTGTKVMSAEFGCGSSGSD